MSGRKLLRVHADLVETLDLGIRQASDPELRQASAPAVSKWAVKDHLEHLAKANEGIVEWMHEVCEGGPVPDPGGGPTMLGRVVLLVGDFPRGRGKAPERTVPQGTGAEELIATSRRVRERVGALQDSLDVVGASRARRNHFAFGDLTPAQWMQFALIHNRHHQKIIRDILRASS